MLTFVRALRYRPYALLWSGQTISILGDKIFQVALAWWVLQKTGSAVAMGTVYTLTTIPMLAFILFGGVLVDRLPRIRMMMLSDYIRGIIILLAAILAFLNVLEIWHVYIFSLVLGTVDAFFYPAFNAVVPDIIPNEDLNSANSLNTLARQLAGVVGPALGATIMSLGGAPLSFGLDAFSFFIAVLCLLPIQNMAINEAQKTERIAPKQVIHDLGEGLKVVKESTWLWLTILIAGLTNMAYAAPMEVGLPFLIKNHLNAGVNVLGYFYSASSIGAVLSAILVGRMKHFRHRGLALYSVWTLIGLFIVAMGLPIGIPGVLLMAMLAGFSSTTLGLIWTNTLQQKVPRKMLGRVTSLDYLGSYILLPVGYSLGGIVTDSFGPAIAFITGGALMTVLVATGFISKQVRELD